MTSHSTANYDRIARSPYPGDGKIQCLICRQWYLKPMGHVFQRHGMNARQYKIAFKLPLKKGVVGEKLHRKFVKMGKANPSWRINFFLGGRKTKEGLNKLFGWAKGLLKKMVDN